MHFNMQASLSNPPICKFLKDTVHWVNGFLFCFYDGENKPTVCCKCDKILHFRLPNEHKQQWSASKELQIFYSCLAFNLWRASGEPPLLYVCMSMDHLYFMSAWEYETLLLWKSWDTDSSDHTLINLLVRRISPLPPFSNFSFVVFWCLQLRKIFEVSLKWHE